jgi:hypothetical protein
VGGRRPPRIGCKLGSVLNEIFLSLHPVLVETKSGIFRCVHGFDFWI